MLKRPKAFNKSSKFILPQITMYQLSTFSSTSLGCICVSLLADYLRDHQRNGLGQRFRASHLKHKDNTVYEGNMAFIKLTKH